MMSLKNQHWNLLSLFILGTGFIWIWLSAAPLGSTTSGQIPAPRAGFLAPDFTLETLDGDSFQLSNLRGQVVLINIWASWCLPCQAEMPAIQQVYDDYQENGFVVLAVNTANQDNPNQVRSFRDDYDLTFPILLDTTGNATNLYQVRALPTSIFVDQNGIIQEVVVGGPMSEALLRTRIEQLLEVER